MNAAIAAVPLWVIVLIKSAILLRGCAAWPIAIQQLSTKRIEFIGITQSQVGLQPL